MKAKYRNVTANNKDGTLRLLSVLLGRYYPIQYVDHFILMLAELTNKAKEYQKKK